MTAKLRGADRAPVAAELRAQYEAGATIRGLATANGRSYSYIRDLLLHADTMLRPRGYSLATHPRGAAR